MTAVVYVGLIALKFLKKAGWPSCSHVAVLLYIGTPPYIYYVFIQSTLICYNVNLNHITFSLNSCSEEKGIAMSIACTLYRPI